MIARRTSLPAAGGLLSARSVPSFCPFSSFHNPFRICSSETPQNCSFYNTYRKPRFFRICSCETPRNCSFYSTYRKPKSFRICSSKKPRGEGGTLWISAHPAKDARPEERSAHFAPRTILRGDEGSLLASFRLLKCRLSTVNCQLSEVLSYQTLAHSFALSENSTLLFSADCALFRENARVGGITLWIARRARDHGYSCEPSLRY